MKEVLKLTFCLSLFMTILLLHARGQVGTLAQVSSPHSPDAGSLGRYVEVPVGHYSGVPSISVPLYALQVSDMTLPISISYHASGLKVRDIPGSVGSGWSLQAGGVINRVVRGFPDDHDPYIAGVQDEDHYHAEVRSRIDDAFNSGFNNIFNAGERHLIAVNTPGIYSEEHHEGPSSYMRMDTEYDLFYFNFAGHTGRFTFDNDNKPMLLSGENLKVEYTDRKFKITDAEGIEYYFESLEQSMDEGTSIRYYSEGRLYTTSWYMSRIHMPQKGETISFSYKSYHNYELYDQSSSSQYAYGRAFSNHVDRLRINNYTMANYAYGNSVCDPFNSSVSSTMVHHFANALFLDEINWREVKIKFHGSLTRQDLYKYKMDSIQVSSNGGIVKRIRMHYGYFNAGLSERHYRRLRLDSVHVDDQHYGFGYINTVHGLSTPPIDSRGQDYWGYYNAEDENLMLGGDFSGTNMYSRYQYTPYYKVFDTHPEPNIPFYIPYRNSTYKNPDATYGQLGTLNRITYPTGGSSYFTYEGNDYSYFPFVASGTIETDPFTQLKLQDLYTKQCRALYLFQGTPEPSGTRNFVIHQSQQVGITGHVGIDLGVSYEQYTQQMINWWPMANLRLQRYDEPSSSFVDVASYEVSPVDSIGEFPDVYTFDYEKEKGLKTISRTLWLEAGRYRIVCEATGPGTVSSMDLSLRFDYKSAVGIYKAGGLRVKRIEFVAEPGGANSSAKNFTYRTGSLSSGVLESPFANISRSLHYGKYNSWSEGQGFYHLQLVCDFLNMNSEPIIPLGNAQGGVIGYGKVDEQDERGGHTEYRFTTGQDDPPTMADQFMENSSLYTRTRLLADNSWKRGLQKSIRFYTATGDTVSAQYTDYQFHTDMSRRSISVVLDNIMLGGGSTYAADVTYIQRRRCAALMSRDSIVNHSAQGPIYKVTRYTYNTANHFYPVKEQHYSDPAHYTIINTRYVQDFAPAATPVDSMARGIRTMLDRHVVSPVVERYVQRWNNVNQQLYTVEGVLNQYHPDSPLRFKTYGLQSTVGMTGFMPLASHAEGSAKDAHYVLEQALLYNSTGRVVQEVLKGGRIRSYLWGYNGQYPVAQIENAGYAQVETALGAGSASLIAALNLASVSDNTIQSTVETIRQNLAGSQVSSYTYKPLVGMTSMTDPRGIRTEYKYDGFQRLKDVFDFEGNVLKNYRYHYRERP